MAIMTTSYTNPSAPTSVYMKTIKGESIKTGSYYYYKDKGHARLYWPAGTPGTNNPIIKYKIYISFKGGAYLDTTVTSSQTTTINGNTYYYYDVGGDGDAVRGDYQTYKIQAIGKYSNSNLSSATSPRLYKNRLPSNPTGGIKVLASKEEKGPLPYTIGSDPDGQTVKIYYSKPPNRARIPYDGRNLDLGTYYIWSYDGLEFSENYSESQIKKTSTEPKVYGFDTKEINFTPYCSANTSDTSFNYVIGIELYNIGTTHSSDYDFTKYNIYYSQGPTATSDGIINPTGVLISSLSVAPSENSPIFLDVEDIITPGYFFKIGVSVTTTLNETSEIKWGSDTYCCGKALTINDFSSLEIEINSKIDNNKKEISAADDIANSFNNYIRITWTNPEIKSIRFGIAKIECGITNNNTTTFTPITTETDSGEKFNPNLTRGKSNIGYLNIGNSVARGSTVIPAIRVTPIYGDHFIVSSKAEKTRTNLLKFEGAYSINPPTWNFFIDDDVSNISFNGNKIRGDAGFATISNVTIENDQISSPYGGKYETIDSSVPGKISFNNEGTFGSFKEALNALNLDSLISSTYTITVTDRYGNSASTEVSQSIDFRVAPTWPNDAKLTTKVLYLNSGEKIFDSNDSSEVDENLRILNPGEIISLSWNQAKDSGNGKPETVKYKIICYTKASTKTLYYENGSKFFEYITDENSCEFSYIVPYGNTTVNSIFFEVIAIDQSGKTSTSLKTSQNQALAIGRAVVPDYDIVSYEISEKEGEPTGVLTGVLEVKDYGDSRIINSSWTNYARLEGLKLAIRQQNGEQKILTYDNNFIFSDTGYPKLGKVVLSFSLYPSYIDSLNSNKTYLFSFEGPTFSYRSHQIGINIPADSTSIEKSAFSVAAADGKDRIYFVSNSPDLEDIYLNLTEGKIYNLIIDCGEW